MNCVNCGAPINLNNERNSVVICCHCGSSFRINNANPANPANAASAEQNQETFLAEVICGHDPDVLNAVKQKLSPGASQKKKMWGIGLGIGIPAGVMIIAGFIMTRAGWFLSGYIIGYLLISMGFMALIGAGIYPYMVWMKRLIPLNQAQANLNNGLRIRFSETEMTFNRPQTANFASFASLFNISSFSHNHTLGSPFNPNFGQMRNPNIGEVYMYFNLVKVIEEETLFFIYTTPAIFYCFSKRQFASGSPMEVKRVLKQALGDRYIDNTWGGGAR